MEQLVATKLFIPPTRPGLIYRQRLIDRLNTCAYPGCKLILITAPAGYGKTTLVTEWLGSLHISTSNKNKGSFRAAWFSLDEGDNDPVRFFSYFYAALNKIEGIKSALGKGALGLLQSNQLPPPKIILTSLINEIAAFPEKIILVLDDYHLIDNRSIHDALSFFLDNLPPQMHLVIATREDPHMPLSRLRTRGQMTELRASDLRFTPAEATEYLNRVMGLNLSSDDIASLEARTEGWIAGLQLAALSMRGYKDAASLINAFTGSHRLIQDFLIDEVLSQQSESIQEFLLHTSILDQLTSPICDALTQQNNSQATLESLERANLFIIPQDCERRSFRYHHLFADLLRIRLQYTQPERIPELHYLASKWYEENGYADEAITHALHGEDFNRAINLIEQNVDTIWAQGEYTKLQRWLKGLPDELVHSRPQLCIFRAWELFASGQPDAGERFLRNAELAHFPSTDLDSVTESNDQAQKSGLSGMKVRGRAAAIQAWIAAYQRQNISGLIQHLRQALDYLPEQDLPWRSAVEITLADVYAFNGDIESAHQVRLEALKSCEASGNTYLFLYNSAKLALNLKAQGQLQQVHELCQQRIQYAYGNGMSQTAVVGWLLAIWGEVLVEINELDGAYDLLEKSIEKTEPGGDVGMLGWSYLGLIRFLFAKGDMAGAEKIVQKINMIAQESIVPTWIMNLNAAWQSRIWLAQGKLEAATRWARDSELVADKSPSYLNKYKYITMARILIANGQEKDSTRLLQDMLKESEVGGDTTRAIEILILQALALHARGNTNQAVDTLESALAIAEPKGFFRIFVDEGQPMARLLYKTFNRDVATNYVNGLLQAFPLEEPEQVESSVSHVSEPAYIEPLSKREIEVLLLIAEGLTNPEIAARLILSLYTVKTHTRNIYGKLGVNNRIQAVAKARTLGILSTT
jgi:LuxR family maltose regulon positive regulatory protein